MCLLMEDRSLLPERPFGCNGYDGAGRVVEDLRKVHAGVRTDGVSRGWDPRSEGADLKPDLRTQVGLFKCGRVPHIDAMRVIRIHGREDLPHSGEKAAQLAKEFSRNVCRRLPPLKTIRSLRFASVNSIFRIQQTQKSFSTTAWLAGQRIRGRGRVAGGSTSSRPYPLDSFCAIH
jgi:hypothetical protein